MTFGCRREEADAAWEREDPLADGDCREHVPDEVRRAVLHASGSARWTDVGLAGEGHEPFEAAIRAADPDEAAGEDAAVEVTPQVALDERRQTATVGRALAGRGEERLEPFPDDGVQDRVLRLATAVAGERCPRGAGPGFPDLAGF